MQDKSGSSSPKSTCVSYNGTNANVEFRTSSTNALQHKEIGNGHAIKARKPYTISKQRERWTKEEHDNFLEALKLYGRAWRRIEEHVGSKTTVQIRSHAQKFFSKVSRESTADCSVKAVEIPPARPKRKPSRPYPRNRSPVLEKLECSPLWISSKFEQKGSPTSVLTAAESETMKSGISNLLTGCASPVLSVVGSNPVGMSWSDPVEENRSSSTCPASTGLTADQKFATESNSGLDQDSPMETQAATLKLFGMTVLVTDSQKPCSSINRDSMQSPNPSNSTEIQSTNMVGGDPFGASGMWPIGVPPAFFVMPSYGDPVGAAVGSPLFPLSWWLPSCGKESVVSSGLESSPNSAFRRVKSGSNMSAKGFLPYTRCVAERDVHNPLMADIDEDDGGLNLCL